MRRTTLRQMNEKVRHGLDTGGKHQILPVEADLLPEPREIQNGNGVVHGSHLGVGMVSMRPSAWITVLVPLPFGTTIDCPPFGLTVVW